MIGLSIHIRGLLKVLQREHKLFVDVNEDEVRMKYLRTLPKGTNSLDFYI